MGTLTVNGYCEYDTVRLKLRIDDHSMRDEIYLYMNEIDNLVDNRLRAKLGEFNVYGSPITLPLTHETIPTVPLELKAIANDLVVAKIRLQNSEKPLLWDSQVKVLEDYLDKVYGWTSSKPFQPVRTLTVSPTSGAAGSTVTLSGTLFQPVVKLTFVFDATHPTTTPTDVITDSKGSFSGATFTIPATHPAGSYDIKVFDEFGGKAVKFLVV